MQSTIPPLPYRSSLSSSMATAVNGGDSSTASTANGAHDDANNNETFTPNLNIRLNVSEKARTVTSVCVSGTLCTVSVHEGIAGAPFGSFVDYVLDDQGNPVLLMNEMSMHTINIQNAAQTLLDASGTAIGPGPSMVTLFTQLGSGTTSLSPPRTAAGGASGTAKSNNLQDVSRCSLTGTLYKIDPAVDSDVDAIRMRYSLTHTYADQVMDSPKFAFYRLVPEKIYFVGGFGVMAKWVDPEDYAAAAPDILAKEASAIVAKLNREHGEDLQNTARHLLRVETPLEDIRVTNVDRLGVDLRVTSQKGSRRNKLQTDEFRIGFRIPVISVEDAKSEILKTFQEAWEIGNGMDWGEANGSDGAATSVPILKIAADGLE
jgi:putative heme iron utilization protein